MQEERICLVWGFWGKLERSQHREWKLSRFFFITSSSAVSLSRMWRTLCYYHGCSTPPPCHRTLVNPCGRGVDAFALMLSKNSVQCVSNLYVSPPVFSTFSLPPLMMISFSFWPRSNSNSLGGLKNFQFSNVFVLYSSSHAFPPGGTILRIIATPKQYLVNFFKMLRSLSLSLHHSAQSSTSTKLSSSFASRWYRSRPIPSRVSS